MAEGRCKEGREEEWQALQFHDFQPLLSILMHPDFRRCLRDPNQPSLLDCVLFDKE